MQIDTAPYESNFSKGPIYFSKKKGKMQII